MYRIPLHALNLEGKTLIKRSPIVYSYSASLMAVGAERRNNTNTYRDGKSVVIGHPKNNSIKTMATASIIKQNRAVSKQL